MLYISHEYFIYFRLHSLLSPRLAAARSIEESLLPPRLAAARSTEESVLPPRLVAARSANITTTAANVRGFGNVVNLLQCFSFDFK